MSARRSLLDSLRSRPDPDGSESKAGADPEGGAPVPEPVRPTRMVVSGELPFGEHDRAVADAPTRFGLDPRWRLWRDTSAVLVVLALVIAFSDWLPRPEQAVLSQTDAPPTSTSVPTPVGAISVPAPCASSGVDLTFDGTGSTDTTDYAWDFGDTATSMSAVATHAFAVDGTYFVTLVVVGPGGTDSESVSITVPCP